MKAVFILVASLLGAQAEAQPNCQTFSSRVVCVGDQLPIAVNYGVFEGIVVDIRPSASGRAILYWTEVGDPSGEIKTSGYIGFNKGDVPGFPGRKFNESFVTPAGVEDKFIAYSPSGPYYYVEFGDTKKVERVGKQDLDFRYSTGSSFTVRESHMIFDEKRTKPSKDLKEYESQVESVLLNSCKRLNKSSSVKLQNVEIKFTKVEADWKLFHTSECLPLPLPRSHYHIQVSYEASAECTAD